MNWDLTAIYRQKSHCVSTGCQPLHLPKLSNKIVMPKLHHRAQGIAVSTNCTEWNSRYYVSK